MNMSYGSYEMRMSTAERQEMRRKIALVGGATQSIFPEAEALFTGDDEYAEALHYFASRKKITHYRSLMDFVFCELHPEWQGACRRFYRDKGKPLETFLTQEQKTAFNEQMLLTLKLALQNHYANERSKGWNWLVEQVKKVVSLKPSD